MNKRSISLLMMVVIAFGAMTTLHAQQASSYVMWENIMITPDNTKLKVLGENMRKHNQKYHKDGPNTATVYNISTGPNVGKILWQMGPLTYTHLDARPSKGGHDQDWRDNVMPYVKKMNTAEYWKQGMEISNTAMLDGDNTKYPLLYIRVFEVHKGQGQYVERYFKQVSETVKAMEGENPWGIYYNEFQQGYDIGRHIATVGFLKNWAQLDDESYDFKKTFLKVHGENSWEAFQRDYEETFSNSWDEIWSYNATLSGK